MPLTIELAGAHPENKGAMLMLESAVAAVRAKLPEARLVVSYRLPADERRRLGLAATRPADRIPRRWAALWRWLPRPLARLFGLVKRDEIDVVLDISGFAYGDVWPLEKLRHRLLDTISGANGRPPLVVLMPQAFGPFENPGHAELMRQVLGHRPLIYARDELSREFLVGLDREAAAVVRLAPDFTNLLEVEPAPGSDRSGALIVPNSKIPQHGDAEAYEGFLAFAAGRLEAAGWSPRFLVHEGEADHAIAVAVNRRLETPLPILRTKGAIEAKALLAGSGCVLSSRYHALIGALATGVPALACGWSHKYAALMTDYGLPDMLVDLAEPEAWDDCLARLVELASRDPAPLLRAARSQKDAAQRMWEEVLARIGQRATPA